MTQRMQVLVAAAVVVVAFLVGFGWQWFRADGLSTELERTRDELATERLEATLATAALLAERGSFEGARRMASEFFTGLQEELEGLPEARRPALREILEQRDVTITILSRAEEEGRAALRDMLNRYRVAVGVPGDALPLTEPEPRPGAAPTDTFTPPSESSESLPPLPGVDTAGAGFSPDR